MAQLGNPDMRTPIAYGLAYPERIDGRRRAARSVQDRDLQFCRTRFRALPLLALAYQALRAAGTAPAILNAANEVAVGRLPESSISPSSNSSCYATCWMRCRSTQFPVWMTYRCGRRSASHSTGNISAMDHVAGFIAAIRPLVVFTSWPLLGGASLRRQVLRFSWASAGDVQQTLRSGTSG